MMIMSCSLVTVIILTQLFTVIANINYYNIYIIVCSQIYNWVRVRVGWSKLLGSGSILLDSV